MKIEIVKTMQASPNGIRTELYQAGEVYEVGSSKMPEPLSKVFLKEKWAKEVKPATPAGNKKQDDAAPENKDAGEAPENKSESKKKKGFFGKK